MLQQVQRASAVGPIYEHPPLDVNVSHKMGVVHEVHERVRLPKDSVHLSPTALAAHQLRGEVDVVELAALVRVVILSVAVRWAVVLLRVFVPIVRVGARACGAQSTAVRAALVHVGRVPSALAAVGPRRARKGQIDTYRHQRWCLIALVYHAVTRGVVHHDGRIDAQPLVVSPLEFKVPLLRPRQHERPISIGAQAHIVVSHVVEDSVVLSPHRSERNPPLAVRAVVTPLYRGREGVIHDGRSRNTPVDMGELAAGSLVRGRKLLGALEHGVGALEQLG